MDTDCNHSTGANVKRKVRAVNTRLGFSTFTTQSLHLYLNVIACNVTAALVVQPVMPVNRPEEMVAATFQF